MRCGPGLGEPRVPARGRAPRPSRPASRRRPCPWRARRSRGSGSMRSSRMRAAAARARADPAELDVEDRVRPVVEEDRRDVEPFARLRPQRLQRVHRAAVGLQVHDPSVGARDGGAGGDRHARPIAPPVSVSQSWRGQPAVAPDDEQAAGLRLVRDDRAFGQRRADRLARRLRGERARRRVGPAAGCNATTPASAPSASARCSSALARHRRPPSGERVHFASVRARAGSACPDTRRTTPAAACRPARGGARPSSCATANSAK